MLVGETTSTSCSWTGEGFQGLRKVRAWVRLPCWNAILSSSSSHNFWAPRWSCSSCICFLLGMTGPRLLEVLEITPGTFSPSRHGTISQLQSREEDAFFLFYFGIVFTVHSGGLLASFFLACVLCVGTEHCKCPTWTHLICQYAADGVSDDHCDLPSAYRLGHSKFTYIYIVCIYLCSSTAAHLESPQNNKK